MEVAAVVEVAVMLCGVEEGERRQVLGDGSRIVPPSLILEIFLSPAAPPNSSWIIFIFFRSTNNNNNNPKTRKREKGAVSE